MRIAKAAYALVVGTSLLAVYPASADVELYFDESGFVAATPGIRTVQTFTAANPSLTFPCGVSVVCNACSISGNGVFDDRVTRSGKESTTFKWTAPVYAVGGNWDLATPGGPGQCLKLNAEVVTGGQTFIYQIPNTFAGEFFGFVSDDPIEELTITAGDCSGDAETYTLDNLQYVEPSHVYFGGTDCGVYNRPMRQFKPICSLGYHVELVEEKCESAPDPLWCVSFQLHKGYLKRALGGVDISKLTRCAAEWYNTNHF